MVVDSTEPLWRWPLPVDGSILPASLRSPCRVHLTGLIRHIRKQAYFRLMSSDLPISKTCSNSNSIGQQRTLAALQGIILIAAKQCLWFLSHYLHIQTPAVLLIRLRFATPNEVSATCHVFPPPKNPRLPRQNPSGQEICPARLIPTTIPKHRLLISLSFLSGRTVVRECLFC